MAPSSKLGRLAGTVALTALLVALPRTEPARAAGPHDPAITWNTIETPRFRVHYPDGARNLAVRIAHIAEEELDRVGALFGNVPPGPIEVVVSDAYDDANGSASVLPSDVVNVRLAAPTELSGLSSYDDWLRILLVHELSHICDIDHTAGFTSLLDLIFGPYVRWNSLTPQFLTEGVAVYAETLLTSTGRGRSTYVDMILRTAALDGTFVPLDRAHVLGSEWPGGSSAYFYGGLFHLWLRDRFGQDKVRDLHTTFAALPLPYLYWPADQVVLGSSLWSLWGEWRDEETKKAQAVRDAVQAEGETTSRRLTFHGRGITGSRHSPDGSFIVYSRSSPVDGQTVRRMNKDGTDDRVLVLETYSPRFSFSPDGKSLYYSQSAINERFNQFNDLYRFDVAKEQSTRLHDAAAPDVSLRARDPDVASDGKRIVFVQNRLHQSRVTLGTFDDQDDSLMHLRVLVPPNGDMQQASPRFSPDGRRIALSTWFPGGHRDVVIVDADDGSIVRRVNDDDALDGNPAWSPDGRYVLWESDASGISNVYACDWQAGRYFKVTNVVGGAFQPDVAPDGRTLIFRNASGIGFDIHEMAYAPESWRPVRYAPGQGYVDDPEAPAADDHVWRPSDWAQARPRESEAPLELRPNERDRPYWPESLLPFHHNWVLIPALYIAGDDPSFQLTTFVRDTLGQHGASVSIGSSWYTGHLNWAASYVNDMWYPTFNVGYSDVADAFAATATTAAGGVETRHIVQRTQTAVAGVGLPVRLRHILGLGYVWQEREALDPLAAQLLDLHHPETFARLTFGYAYANTRSYPYSVGREDGGAIAVTGRWYARSLGGSFDELMLTVDGRGYINNPWLPNHVLALRGVAAIAFGPEFRERFVLGGAGAASFFTVDTAQSYPLRGFPLDVSVYPPGTGLLAGYLEYRFPIWQIERGVWELPVFFERLHAAVFSEAGNTFGNGTERDLGQTFEKLWNRLLGARLSAGAEVRLDLVLGWAYGLQVRGGIAIPIFDHGRFPPVPRSPLGRASGFEWVPYLAFGTAL